VAVGVESQKKGVEKLTRGKEGDPQGGRRGQE